MSDIRKEAPAPVRPERRTGLKLFVLAAAGLVVCSLLAGVLVELMPEMTATTLQLVYDVLYYAPFVVLPVFLL